MTASGQGAASEMKNFSREPEAENRLLNLILDSSFGNVFVTDAVGNIIYANTPVAQDMGMSKEELTSMSVFDLVDRHIISYTPSSIAVIKTKKRHWLPIHAAMERLVIRFLVNRAFKIFLRCPWAISQRTSATRVAVPEVLGSSVSAYF